METGTDGAAFGIVCTIDESRDPGLDDRAGAHTAGFKRDVESSPGHSIVAEQACSFANRDDFSMGRGVAVANRSIPRPGEDFAVMDKACADGNFARVCGVSCFFQRKPHKRDVGVREFHNKSENSTLNEI